MKKAVMRRLLVLLVFFPMILPADDLPWRIFSARSQSLAAGSLAFGADPFVLLQNPALLSIQNRSVSGLQYGQDFGAHADYDLRLSSILEADLRGWSDMTESARLKALADLRDLAGQTGGLYGVKARSLGFVARGYGINVQFLQGAACGLFSGSALDKPVSEVSAADIEALSATLANLQGTVISFGTGLRLSEGVHAGAVLHYFNGGMSLFEESLLGGFFRSGRNSREYFDLAINRRDQDLKKLSLDLGLLVEAGPHFKLALVARHFSLTKIELPAGEILFPKRYLAGIAFQPSPDWGFFVDADLRPRVYPVGNHERQPLSISMEKGFFHNQLFLRAGLRADLAAEHLLGSQADLLYSMGLSFHLSSLVIDLAASLDNSGRLNALVATAFYIMK